ncbi:MAG: class F sortase [Streptosporangiaceae bacterium]
MIVIVAGIGLGYLRYGMAHEPDPSTIVPPGVSTSTPVLTKPSSTPVGLPASAPVRIIIPAIEVNAPVVGVGDPGGVVGVPPLSDHNLAGWFAGSVTPGQNGPSLIDGHVDSVTGPSVFFSIKNLKPGDVIKVLRKDGSTVQFRVTWLQSVSKTIFPWKAVLGPTGYPALRLVTCGGPFDYLTGHYVDNIIVYAS